MKITTYASGSDFLADCAAMLEAKESLNNLMLGIARRNPAPANGNEKVRPLFVSVSNGDQISIAALMTPPQRLVIYAVDPEAVCDIESLACHLADAGTEIPGVIGPAGTALSFASAWAAKKSLTFELTMNERVYELTRVSCVPISKGSFKKAGTEDSELLIKWVAEFSKEALGEDVTYESAKKLVDAKIAAGDAYLWVDEKPVTVACAARPTRNGIAVNFVYTPGEFRRRGYATSCVAKLSEALLERGYGFCSLFTDLKNPVSNDIYQKIGYAPVGDFNVYDFKK